MPYYRSYRRTYAKKRYTPRRTYRKKWGKYSNRRGVSRNGKVLLKVRESVVLATDPSGAIDAILLNDPSSTGDWTPIQNMYESAKVCAMKIHFIPSRAEEYPSAGTANWQPLYVAGAQDRVTAPGNSSNMIDRNTLKVFNLYRPFKYYFKLQTRTAVDTSGSTNTIVLAGGYQDLQGTWVTSAGIQLFAAGLANSTSYGQFIVTYYLACKNRH